jgi:hypothetical protein
MFVCWAAAAECKKSSNEREATEVANNWILDATMHRDAREGLINRVRRT